MAHEPKHVGKYVSPIRLTSDATAREQFNSSFDYNHLSGIRSGVHRTKFDTLADEIPFDSAPVPSPIELFSWRGQYNHSKER